MGRPPPLRKLVIDGVVYRWRVQHVHHVLPPPAPAEEREGRCGEVFAAFLDGRNRGGLRVRFYDGDHQHAGYPQAGVVWTSRPPRLEANLNLPSTARRLIELARADGWTPGREPLDVADGFAWLPRLAAPGDVD